uniref:Cadherin domain-containing protein n=1 Tax=Parastrongyloides trichosuri TaxID=131310 RepID=A0A0N5A589_PARTI
MILRKPLRIEKFLSLLFTGVILFYFNYGPFTIFINGQSHHHRRSVRSGTIFQFTKPSYNMSLEENSRGKIVARIDENVRVGVYIPCQGCRIKFRIVRGDPQRQFKTLHKVIGDFAYLHIRQENDVILNREKTNMYQLTVKATITRPHYESLETTANIYLNIRDQNDLLTRFSEEKFQFDVSIDTKPFSFIGQVNAYDSDEGLNGEILYSFKELNKYFYMEPTTGIIRAYKSLKSIGKSEISFEGFVQDRTSRLFYNIEDMQPQRPAFNQPNEAEIKIKILDEKIGEEYKNFKIFTDVNELKMDSSNGQMVARVEVVSKETDQYHLSISNETGFGEFFSLRRSPVNINVYEIWLVDRNFWKFFMQLWKNEVLLLDVLSTHIISGIDKKETKISLTIPVKSSSFITFVGLNNEELLTIDVNECLPSGHAVYVFKALTELDMDEERLRFRIKSKEKDTLPFVIDHKTGVLSVLSSLSETKRKEFAFEIVSKIQGNDLIKSFVNVLIKINPCNAHSPVWDIAFQNLKTMSLGNDTLKSGIKLFILKANDEDEGKNGEVHYKIIDKNDSAFIVSFETGDVYFKNEPSKLTNYWILQAIAVDSGKPYAKYSKPLIILLHREGYQVTDDDLKILQTTKSYMERSKEKRKVNLESNEKLIIMEDANVGDRFGQLIVTDVHHNAEVAGILFSSTDPYFSVDEYSGEIIVVNDLKKLLLKNTSSIREDEYFVYEINIKLYDMLSEDLNEEVGNFPIKIYVKDINNNYPLFNKWAYEFTIYEDIPKDTLIGTISAYDYDFNSKNTLTYKIINKDSNVALRIDSKTGNIYSLEAFDRENAPILNYIVLATDNCDAPLTSFSNLTLIIKDVNDNQPLCLSAEPYTAIIPEDLPNNALITCLVGIDKDEGKNKELNYELFDDNDKKMFFLDNSTGCIFLNSDKPLDYEIQSKYTLKFKISDNGKPRLSTLCTLEIFLEDVNENISPPIFDDLEIEASIEENMPVGSSVIKVHAIDGENSTCNPSYKIIDGDGVNLFEITESGVIKTLSILDHERKSLYFLTISASDCEKVPLTSVAHVNIKVINVNDNAPIFTLPVYMASVSENSTEDTVVCKVEAIDADDIRNLKNQITYSIIKGNFQSQFSIDARTGHIIRGKRKLDREAQKEYELYVNACDNGSPQLCSTVVVILAVNDVNDNGPTVKTLNYSVTVPSGIKGFLHRVISIDNDAKENRDTIYSILTTSNTALSINDMGEIYTKEEIKVKDDIKLEFVVQDKLNSSMQSVINLRIKGSAINSLRHPKNKPPEFVSYDQWKIVQLADNEKLGQAISVFEAHDPDGDALLWEITNTDLKKFFTITNNGELILLVPVTEITIPGNEFMLPFSVTDGSKFINGEVIIRKPKISYYRPSFASLKYYAEINEDSPIGTVIFYGSRHVKPIPQDVLITRRLIYGIHMHESIYTINKLSIDPTNGNVVLLEQVSADQCKNFTIVVFVHLNGKLNFTMINFSINENKKKFNAKIVDKNIVIKNATTLPIFEKQKYLFTYNKNDRKYNNLLVKTSAVLPTYSVPNNLQECEPYQIHPITGLLTLKPSFIIEEFKFFFGICPINVSDVYGNIINSNVQMRKIEAINNPPIFTQMTYYGAIYENSVPGSIVYGLENHKEGLPLTIKAIDEDNGVNGMVTYKIISNVESQYFSVDMFTGIIRTTKSLDAEKAKYQLFYVSAQDLGRPSLISEKFAIVNITILNINDCKPEFEKKIYRFNIKTPISDNLIIGKVKAIDKDENSILQYSLKSTTSENLSFFSINITSGLLTLQNSKRLLQSKNRHYDLVVICSDSIYTTEQAISIEIEDQELSGKSGNINFPQSEYILRIKENDVITKEQSEKPLIIFSLPYIFPLYYNLETNDERFVIERSTGSLYLKENVSFDKETTDSIELIVSVKNLLNFNDYSRTKVILEIEDINDCYPEFSSSFYEGNVPKDAIYGHKISNIKAVDKDSGPNGMVRYTFVGDVPSFIVLNKNDGRIIVNKEISNSYNVGDLFNLTIKATDRGNPPLSAVSYILIRIVDKSLPIFSQLRYKQKIKENLIPNNEVMKVRANSYSNGTIGYFLYSGDEYSSFSVDFYTGYIGTTKALDKELNDKILLKVAAIDTSNPKVYSFTDAEIEVINVNDCAPKFEQNVYRIKVEESISIGSVLIKISAYDIDSNSSTINYKIKNSNNVFRIEEDTGKVILLKNLDYEENSYYELTIIANDEDGFSSESVLIIYVLDVNDNGLKILNIDKEIIIDRKPKKGDLLYFLVVEDKDSVSNLENNQRFLFTIYEDDDSLFEIDSLNGIIAFKRELYPEELSLSTFSKQLNISVTDGLFTEYCMLNVTFKNIVKSHSNFSFEYPIYYGSLDENNALNTFILQVNATNGELPYTYEIVSINSSVFNLPLSIDKSSGKIFLADRLDYETKNQYLIPIKATDNAGFIAITQFNFSVIDSNDNSPKFIYNPKSELKVSVSNDLEVGEYITSILATDDDTKDILEYSINKEYKEGEYFDIHSRQGLISLVKPISQLVNQKLKCQVKVSDTANPPHITSIDFVIEVLPSQTYIPHFSMLRYTFTISNTLSIGSIVGQVEEKENSGEKIIEKKVFFTINNEKDGLPFVIDKNNGKIIVKKQLNLINEKELSFPVFISSSHNGPSSMAIVTIQMNNNMIEAPQFFTMKHRYDVKENLPVGSLVGIISATNSESYELECEKAIENSCPFIIKKDTGEIFINKILDRENVDLYKLNIIAQNGDGLKAIKEILISLIDENDTPSEFVESSREITIDMKKLFKGSVIFNFSVTDKDEYNNINAKITEGNANEIYKIEPIQNMDKNSIIQSFNLIFVGESKNLLNVKEEYISIVVTDGIHFVEKNFLIIFENYPLNDNVDEINEISLNAKENLDIGTVLSILKNNSRFTIINTEIPKLNLPFEINKKNELILSKTLNWNDKVYYNFSIKEEIFFIDNYYLFNIVNYNIKVIDVNDHTPKFIPNEIVNLNVKENIPANSTNPYFLHRFFAADLDSLPNSNVSYKIINNEEHFFEMDPISGILSLIKPLDRESIDNIKLTIRAEDNGGRFSDLETILRIENVNDNAPVFSQKNYTVELLENIVPKEYILKVEATDRDVDDILTYHLHDVVEGDFVSSMVKINEKTGEIYLLQPLDYEKFTELKFKVQVIDNYEIPKIDIADVKIVCLDDNDNPPKFNVESFNVKIKEHTPLGTKIMSLRANDKDTGHYGAVLYSLHGEDSKLFKINEDGDLIIEADLDYEILKSLSFEVHAKDGGQPPLTDKAMVKVEIENINDHPPKFDVCNLTTVIQDGIKKDHSLLTVSLTDEDSPNNTDPYRLLISGDGSDDFYFDNSMTLKTKKNFIHNKKEKYLLEVTAYDIGNQSSTCPLTIFLKQQSKHPPVVAPSYKFTINSIMGEFLGKSIGKIIATDDDENDLLIYSIPTSTPENYASLPIRIDSRTGELFANPDILERTYKFVVSVTDGKYIESTVVTVEVQSINDNDLMHSLNVRLNEVTPADFIENVKEHFVNKISELFKIEPNNVKILSIQPAEEHVLRNKRDISKKEEILDLDLLISIYATKIKDYLRPEFVMKRLEYLATSQNSELPFTISFMNHDVCSEDTCNEGSCNVKVWLDSQNYNIISTNGTVFTSPYHLRTFTCTCKEGFSGRRCDVAVNKCSYKKCTRNEMCIPIYNELNQTDFVCSCPPGLEGTNCNEKKVCKNEEKCSEYNSISMNGDGYFQMTIGKSIEQRLNLMFEFRTISNNGVLFYSSGITDYNYLSIENGNLKYVWNCGTGEGVAIITKKNISDGKWHKVKIYRIGRQATIKLDDEYSAQGASGVGSDVINLYGLSNVLTFGGQVTVYDNPSTIFDLIEHSGMSRVLMNPLISKSITGCIGKVLLDDYELPKTIEGLKVYNVKMGCESTTLGPCIDSECRNGGFCQPSIDITIGRGYSCICPDRYSGKDCEIDLNMCLESPCPPGVQCHSLVNDFFCNCPIGFTGKTCQIRGSWDPCSAKPCGSHGQCIAFQSSFICNCTDGYSGKFCTTPFSRITPDKWSTISILDTIFLMALLAVIFVSIAFTIYMCRRNRKLKKSVVYNELSAINDTHLSSQLLTKGIISTDNQRITIDFNSSGYNNRPPSSCRTSTTVPSSNPPPLPPRYFRNKFSGNGTYQNDLPTVSVRPIQSMLNNSIDNDAISHASSRHSRDILSSPIFNKSRLLLSPLMSNGGGSIQCLDKSGCSTNKDKPSIDLPLKHSKANEYFQDTYVCYDGNGGDYMTMKPKKILNRSKSSDIGNDDEIEPLTDVESIPPPLPPHRNIESTSTLVKENGEEVKLYDNPVEEN